MKKTVQIVTIPLEKDEWNKDGLLLFINTRAEISEYSIAEKSGDNDEARDSFFQVQQLLVLSDDKIQEGDKAKSSYLNNVTNIINEEWVDYKAAPKDVQDSFKKVIASYPRIPGTLSISKETIQEWIDAGTPEKGSIEIKHKSTGRNTIGTTPAGEPIKMNSFIETPKLDSKGNLLLEFYKEQTVGDIRKWLGMDEEERYDTVAVKTKPSIPTDEEIEKKAEQSATKWWTSEPDPESDTLFNEEFNKIKEKWAKQDYCCGYQAGYKQALKDMGYE
jgi:hypothetical protein